MGLGTGPRDRAAEWHNGRMWWYGILKEWQSHGITDLKVPPSLPVSPLEVGPVITSLHSCKQLRALSKNDSPSQNMHADEAGLPITAIA